MPPKSKIPRTVTDTRLLRSMARRRGITLKTSSRAFDNSSETSNLTSEVINGKMGKERSSTSRQNYHKKIEIPVEDPDKPSTDLRWKPKGIIRRLKYLPGKIRNFWRILRPPLTDEEQEAFDFTREEKIKDKLCNQEGRRYGARAAAKLAQIHNPRLNDTRQVKLIRWTMITRDEAFSKIILQMDTNPKRLPPYVLVSRLAADPAYSDDLAAAIGLPVKWDVCKDGVTLTIYRPVTEPTKPREITIEDLLANGEDI